MSTLVKDLQRVIFDVEALQNRLEAAENKVTALTIQRDDARQLYAKLRARFMTALGLLEENCNQSDDASIYEPLREQTLAFIRENRTDIPGETVNQNKEEEEMKTPKHCKGCKHLTVTKLPAVSVPYCNQFYCAVTDKVAGRCKLTNKKETP